MQWESPSSSGMQQLELKTFGSTAVKRTGRRLEGAAMLGFSDFILNKYETGGADVLVIKYAPQDGRRQVR